MRGEEATQARSPRAARAWLLALLALLLATCARGTTLDVATFADLAAAVGDPSVSGVTLQGNIVLDTGLTLNGRALAVSGNATACAAASVPPPPPSPPPGPGPASVVDPEAVTGASGSDNVATAPVPYDGRCTLSLSTANNARHFTLLGANLTLTGVALIGGSFNRTTEASGPPPPQGSAPVRFAYSFTAALTSPTVSYYLGGGAVYADNTSWFAATSSSFALNTGWPRGGAIASLNTAVDAVSLTNCAVKYNDVLPTSVVGTVANRATTTYVFSDNNGETAVAGGGIWAVGGVTLSGCDVSHNVVILINMQTDVYGGAVMAPAVTVSNSTFSGNLVQGKGGAIVLGSCITYQSTTQMMPSSSPFGGTCRLSLDGATFTSNTAVAAGGAIFATPDSAAFSSISVVNSAFKGNSAGSSSAGQMLSGGAMYLLAANVSISGSSFINNSVSGALGMASRSGGAIAMSSNHQYCQGDTRPGSTYALQGCASTGGVLALSIQTSRFSGNSASDSGGAISMAAQGRAEKGGLPTAFCVFSVTSTQFDGNSVENNHGGAILLSNVQIVADRLVCTGNTAPQYGGCIASGVGGGQATGPVLLTSSALSGNSAAWGGAFAVNCVRQDSDETQADYYLRQGAACNETLTISNTSFSANTASYLGGALFMLSGGSLHIQSGSVLSGNSVIGAFPAGGGIFMGDYDNDFVAPALLIDASTLSNNSVVFTDTSSTLGPGEALLQSPIFGAGQGGGVFLTATSVALLNSSTFATVVVSGGSVVASNAAVSGAGLSLYGKVSLAVSGSTLSSNVATSTGGALLLQGAGTATSSARAAVTAGTSFVANAAKYGGAVAINSGAAFTAQNSSFLSNSASLGGGGFMLQVGSLASPSVTLSGVIATGNTALAGALAFTNSTTAISAPAYDAFCILNNTASYVGSIIATAPVAFNVSFPTAALRADVAIGYAVQLWDAFGQFVSGWPSTTATLTPSDPTAVSGPVMAYYDSGAANFSSTYIKGPINATYNFVFAVQSTQLSAALTATSSNLTVSISPCREHEVFDDASQKCLCAAGAYPDSSSGLCELCSVGTYSARGSSACSACESGTVAVAKGSASCTSCPSNSLSVSNVCACSSGYYDTLFGASDTAPVCATCPTGGTCTTGLVAAAEGYWRETLLDDVFLQCREGNCVEETVIGPLSSTTNTTSSNVTAVRRRLLNASSQRVWEATNCVEGNTGPLCGLCLPGYTIQSGVCAVCSPGDSFANWNGTFKSLLYAAAVVFGFLAVAVLFFQPLIPRLDKMVDATIEFGTNATTRAKECLKCACCRKKPEEDAEKTKPEADAEKAKPETTQKPETAAPDAQATAAHTGMADAASDHAHAVHHHGAAVFHAKHYSDAARNAHHEAANFQLAGGVAYAAGVASALRGPGDDDDGGDASDSGGSSNEGGSVGGFSGDGGVDIAVNFTDDVQRALDKLQKMSKIFVNFYQIVTSFLTTLDVKWPSFFVTIMARANVINLNLVQLPKTACMSPSPDYYKQFNGYTLGLIGYTLAAVAIWHIGKHLVARFTLRGLSEEEIAERRARFNSIVLQRVLLILYLCYPGVSVAIVGMFSCVTLRSGESFLNADLNIQCWNTLHWRYVAAAVVWVFIVPVGVPILFIRLLHRFHVPQLARLKTHNAWLRECVKKLWEQGIAQPTVDPMLCTVHSISDVHLELLSAVLLKEADKEQAADILSGVLTGTAFEEALEAEAKAAEAAKAAETDEHPGFAARIVQRVKALKERGKARVSHTLGIAVDETIIQSDARREILLQRLLLWAPSSGELAIPTILWVEEAVAEAVEAPPAGEKDGTGEAVAEEAPPDGEDVAQNAQAPRRSEALLLNALELLPTELYPAKTKLDQYHNIRSEDVNAMQKAALEETGFLFAAYHCNCWYWEVVELARKLILTSLLALVQPGSATQVTVGVLIAFLMLLLNLRLKPFNDDTLNFVNTIAQLNLFFFMFVALLLKVQVDGSQSDSAFFTAIVGVMSIAPVVLPIVLKLVMKLSINSDQKRDMKGIKDNMDDGFG